MSHLSRATFVRFAMLAVGSSVLAPLQMLLFGCSTNGDQAGASALAEQDLGSNNVGDLASASTQDTVQSANGLTGQSLTQPVSATRFVFDTVIQLRAYCSEDLLEAAADRCEYFESIFSRTREGSDIYRINNANGASTAVQLETADIIKKGIEFGKLSKGLFDITIGAVSELWDFKNGVVPDAALLAQAASHVDYQTVVVTNDEKVANADLPIVTLTDSLARIDLGGIAKGYIADDIARFLRAGGCKSALINLGGNVYALGAKPDGSSWSVGIQEPYAPTGTLRASVDARDLSVVTSGAYERGFERNGERYHHILDAQTGYPCKSDVFGASILSSESITGDVFSTTAILLGIRDGLDFLEQQSEVEALLIDESGNIKATSKATYHER